MRFKTVPIAVAALTLCGAQPVAAQTSMTIQAEGMARTYYELDGSLIKAISYSSPATATQTFSGPSGTYNIQVFVQLETDGQPTLELYRGSTLLRSYVYPLGTALTSFTISNVALTTGQQLRLVGRIQGGAHARVDRMVLTQVAAATPTPTTTTPTPTTTTPTTTTPPTTSASAITMQAEGMTRTNYALDGSLIKATSHSSPNPATQAFSGASGTYNMRVYVQQESDGTPTLEVYKGSTLLRCYVYPLGSALTSFTISNVALTAGQQVRLVGRIQGGAHARVDKIVFEPVATSTTPTTTTPTTTTPPTTSASAITMQAEGMTRTNYALDGSLIKATSYSSPNTATQAFSGASGTYNMRVYVQQESDGTPTLEVYKGSTLLRCYVYPLGSALTSFTISNVALTAGQQVRLVGRIQGGAHARVDKIVFEPVATSTTPTTTTPTTTTPPTTTASAITMQAEGMTRTNYALDGSLIKATSYSSPNTATQAFSGASGTYNMRVYVQQESDGTPTLEVYKGSTL